MHPERSFRTRRRLTELVMQPRKTTDAHFKRAVEDESGAARFAARTTGVVNNPGAERGSKDGKSSEVAQPETEEESVVSVLNGTENTDEECLVGAGGFEPP